MTVVCSRHGLVQSARRLTVSCHICLSHSRPSSTTLLTRDAPASVSTQHAAEEPLDDSQIPHKLSVNDADGSARTASGGAVHPPSQPNTDPTSAARHENDILYDEIRHQLQLRSPSDILRRSFFRSSAVIRSKRITAHVLELLQSGQHESFTRFGSGLETTAEREMDISREETDGNMLGATESTLLDSSWHQTLLDLPERVRADRPAILCALISAQLDGCIQPADVLRVYVTALQNADATEALKSITYDNQELDPWFTRLGGDPEVVRVLSTVIRRLGNVGIHVSLQLVEAGLLRSAEHFNLDGLRRFLVLLQDLLNTGGTDRESAQYSLGKVLAALRRAALLRQSEKKTSQRDIHCLRENVYGPIPGHGDSRDSALDLEQPPRGNEGCAIRLFFEPSGLEAADPQAYADYIVLLGLSQLRDPVVKGWEVYTASTHYTTTRTEPNNPIMRAYTESFLMLGRLDLAWQTLRASAFRAGEADAAFELTVLRRAIKHPSWRSMAESLEPEERANWQRRLDVHRETVEHELSAALEGPLEEMERALGVQWHAEDGKHVLDANFAKLCGEELGGGDAIEADADVVLQRFVMRVWGRDGEDAVQEVQRLADAEDELARPADANEQQEHRAAMEEEEERLVNAEQKRERRRGPHGPKGEGRRGRVR